MRVRVVARVKAVMVRVRVGVRVRVRVDARLRRGDGLVGEGGDGDVAW